MQIRPGTTHGRETDMTIPQEFKDYTATQAGNSIKSCESQASDFGNGFAQKNLFTIGLNSVCVI